MARIALAFAAFVGHSGALMFDVPQSEGEACVVWHSQHKSAGATFEDILSEVALKRTRIFRDDWRDHNFSRFICDKETWHCERQRCVEGPEFRPYRNYKVAFRGYVQVLAGSEAWGRAGTGQCVWATMFRDPVARLVSAYMYCKNGWHRDPLCGYDRLPPENITLEQFAEHWGNFLFRELLWFPELHALAASRPDYKPAVYCTTDEQGRSLAALEHVDLRDPWVAFKDQLNGGDRLDTESGRQNFEKVKDSLFGRNGAKPLYDVIGVVSHFNDSMALFDEAMPLGNSPGWKPEVYLREANTHGSEAWKAEEKVLLADTRQSPHILQHIQGDIELYEGVEKQYLDAFTAYQSRHKSFLTQINEPSAI